MHRDKLDLFNALLSKLTEHQLFAREFFCADLMASIASSYQPDAIAICYFDTEGRFLSILTPEGLRLNEPSNPFAHFAHLDVVRHTVHRDAVHDGLTYFNTVPRLYKSTDIIDGVDYDGDPYVSFIEQQFGAHYSVTMAFGINAYIQMAFYKTRAHGDFTDDEMRDLEQLYIYIASSYRTFKKYEQARIVSEIMERIIATGERAFFIADDFSHMMSCNELAESYLEELLGASVADQIETDEACSWLPFVINGCGCGRNDCAEAMHEHAIKNFRFKVHPYDRTYSNGIVDRYWWATVSKCDAENALQQPGISDRLAFLTRSEQRVAALLMKGLTYQEIADKLVISFHTVKKHVQSIYKKCDVNSRLQFLRYIDELHDR